jgi:hypothetical protein
MRFFKNNKWETVIIDDFLPYSKSGTLAFGHCLDPLEMWVPLLEKAYAKLHGSYEALETGSEATAFFDLTGFPPEER